ncbi:MAG TPA: adenylate kinase [Jatrophihabitantaceae bacterium]|jgi:adenylate kinase|nr:adenylate kinase [Jatrophihabitantaceae bacterium]
MNVVLIGPPGSGKGTQGELLAARLGIEHIAVGDLLRAEVAAGSAVGQEAASYMNRGELVPDEVILRLLLPRVFAAAAKAGYLLDGFPRSVEQAESVRAEASRRGAGPDAVIYLDVPRPELMRRILGRAAREGRADDNEATVATRLQVFEEETRPLVDYYRGRRLLKVIDADRPEADVTASLLAALGVAG